MSTRDEHLEFIKSHCLVNGVDELARGLVRAATKLKYLDGASIDVFLTSDSPNLFEQCTLTDMGQTLAKLAEYGVRPKEKKVMIREAIDGLSGVRRVKDQLQILVSPNAVTMGLIDLAQACVRVSCLAFTKRAVQKREFSVRVYDALRDTGKQFEEKYAYKGPYRRDVHVDYRFSGLKRPAAILQLTGGHTQANEVFRKWSDLERTHVQDTFVTIYDDSREPENPDDLERLQDKSKLLAVSNRKAIAALVNAA